MDVPRRAYAGHMLQFNALQASFDAAIALVSPLPSASGVDGLFWHGKKDITLSTSGWPCSVHHEQHADTSGRLVLCVWKSSGLNVLLHTVHISSLRCACMLYWLLRTSVRKIGRLPLWDTSLVSLSLLNRCNCREIERRHSCLMLLLVSGHLQAEWNLIYHLNEPIS